MNLPASPRALIIGGRGFIGSAITRAAREAGWNVTAVGRDDCPDYVRSRFDVVINADGNARRFKANNEPVWDFDSSVRPVYQSLQDFPSAHYVLISSVDVYNDTSTPAVTTEGTAIDLLQLSPYGFHKRIAELCVMRQAHSWQIFRLAQMVGENMKKGPLFDLLEGRPVWIHPTAQLHYMNTRTAGAIIIRLIDDGPRNEIYNVCGRGSVEFARILDLFVREGYRPAHADSERQMYGINTDKTHRLCSLPDSWMEVRAFIEASRATRKTG